MVVSVIVGLGFFACPVTAANMLTNGDFESGFVTAGQVTSGGNTTVLTATATSLAVSTGTELPYISYWKLSHHRQGFILKMTSGSLNGQTRYIHGNSDNHNISFDAFGSAPAVNDTFEIWTACPNNWTPESSGTGETDKAMGFDRTDITGQASEHMCKVHGGTYALKLWDAGKNVWVISDSVNVTGSTSYNLGWWDLSNASSNKVYVAVKDQAGATLYEYEAVVATTGTWEQHAISFDTNADSTSVQVWLGHKKYENTGDRYVNFDDVTLTPEPATMTLLLLGLPFALRRRKR